MLTHPVSPTEPDASLICCCGKNLALATIFREPAPEPINTMLAGFQLPPRTKQFRDHIRAYNSALQMASSGIHVASPRQGISMIAVTGAIYHLLGPLLANTPEQAKFAQLYIIDSHAHQLHQRIAAFGQGNHS